MGGAVVFTDNNGLLGGFWVSSIFLLPFRLFCCCLLSYSSLLRVVVVSSFSLFLASFDYNDWPARPLDNEAIFFVVENEFSPRSPAGCREMHLFSYFFFLRYEHIVALLASVLVFEALRSLDSSPIPLDKSRTNQGPIVYAA